jgi:hypothetical protein
MIHSWMIDHPGWHTIDELQAELKTSNIRNKLVQLRKWGMVEHDGNTPRRWRVTS